MSPERREHESRGRADRPAASVPEDLVSMLDQLALTIVEALRFGVVAVNIACPDGSFQVAAVAGDDEARKALLGHVETAETWERVLSTSEPWGRLRFSDHHNVEAGSTTLMWVPDVEALDVEDAWHQEDALYAPLTSADGTLQGILSVDLPHDGRRPNQASRRSLEAFAMATSLAIEHSTLRARAEASDRMAQELASHDALTGLGNRSVMSERLEHAASARAGQRKPLALLFIDLDGFKTINDLHTHAAGDLILQAVGKRLRSVVRPHDTVVRWGGDEFLVLLEHLDDEGSARKVAQRILVVVADPVPYRGLELRVTASVGMAFGAASDQLDPDVLVRRADTAMYRVKKDGGNRYAVDGSGLAEGAGRSRDLVAERTR